MLWLARALELLPEEGLEEEWTIRVNMAARSQQLMQLGAVLVHGDAVLALALSPDGRTCLTGCRDGKTRFWDTRTGQPIGPFLPEEYGVWAVAFHPRQQLVLTVSEPLTKDGTVPPESVRPSSPNEHARPQGIVRFWDARTGEPACSLSASWGKVITAAFSPDGQTVVTGHADGTARLWDSQTGQPKGGPLKHDNGVRAAAFSPDGQLLISSTFNDLVIHLWNASSGEPLGPIFKPPRFGLMGVFSPDGQSILCSLAEHRAVFLDRDTRLSRIPPLQHQDRVQAVAISPDNQKLLTGSWDGTARVWAASSGKPFAQPLRHGGQVVAALFAPQGNRVLTGSWDHTARLWNLPADSQFYQLGPDKERLGSAALSSDGRLVVRAGQGSKAEVLDAATGQRVGPALEHSEQIRKVAFGPGNTSVLTIGSTSARLWEVGSGKLQHSYSDRSCPLDIVAFSPEGKTILLGDEYSYARLWHLEPSRAILLPVEPHARGVVAAAFSPDGRAVLTGNVAGVARVWDAATGRPLGPPIVHPNRVQAVAFHPDGQMLWTAAGDRIIRRWNAKTSEPLGLQLKHQGEAAVFARDGRTALIIRGDGISQLWDLRLNCPLGLDRFHNGRINEAMFSRDGSTLLTLGPERGADKYVIVSAVPAPLEGSKERVVLWAQVTTGLRLSEKGMATVLDGEEWQGCRHRLDQLGGPLH